MFDFRISLFGWGAGIIYIPMKLWQLRSISICIIITKLTPRDQALPCFALLCLVCLFEKDLRLRILGYEDIQGESLVTSFFLTVFFQSLRHQVFPHGPQSKYYPGPIMLNSHNQMPSFFDLILIFYTWKKYKPQ